MEVTGRLHSINRDWNTGKIILSLELNEEPTEDLNFIASCERLSVSIKKFRKKRSLDANGYCWALMTEIANHPDIKSSKEEVYEDMLQKYGFLYKDDDGYITMTIKSEVDASKVPGHWAFYKSNGKFTSYLMIKGSSEYDTAEMAHFIDMIVQEAKELGIETATPDELARMKGLWGNEKHNSK